MKKIMNLMGAKKLSVLEQKLISGGFWGACQPQIILCESDQDCPCGSCGIIIDGPSGPINISDICAF